MELRRGSENNQRVEKRGKLPIGLLTARGKLLEGLNGREGDEFLRRQSRKNLKSRTTAKILRG